MQILVTGCDGLVGSAIVEESKKSRHTFKFVNRKSADLTDQKSVDGLINRYRPNWIINCAAKVGGIAGNMSGHADYFYKNILMNSHIIDSSHRYGVEKVLMFSSVCVFPHDAEVLKEENMLEGHPFEGNFAYGWAKRMVDVQISAYKKQFDVKNYSSIVPGNIFGPNDLYNLKHAHVLPALIHKIYLAKKSGTPLVVWGDGSAQREFIYSKDLAKSILKIIELPEIPQRIIISGEQQVTIKEIVERLCVAANFNNGIQWDTSKPSGQKARPTDLSVVKSLIGNINYTNLDEALRNSYNFFEENYPNVRL
jgi:GDP-L-fucose synthase